MPEMRTITARSKPYRDNTGKHTPCIRCGRPSQAESCKDCRPECIQLGWITPPATYTCQRCGQEKRANTPANLDRTHCKGCKSHLTRHPG